MAAPTRTIQLVQRLCDTIANPQEDTEASKSLLDYALRLLSSNISPSVEPDELALVDTIKASLHRNGREDDVVRFGELYHQLTSKTVVTRRWAALLFLFEVGRDSATATTGTIGQSLFSADSVVCSSKGTGLIKQNAPVADAIGPVIAQGGEGADTSGTSPAAEDTIKKYQALLYRCGDTASKEISESALVRDLLFVFLGIDGQVIRFNPVADRFCVANDVSVPQPTRNLAEKLAELGWLFMKIDFYVKNRSADPTAGLVERAFCGALRDELNDYFRMVSVLEGQLNAEVQSSVPQVTLRRLAVWICEPLQQMQMLALLVDGCKGYAGGSIASIVYKYSKHGDVSVQKLIKRILVSVNHPMYSMLNRWIYHGELEDIFGEFFISDAPGTPQNQLWDEKYSIRAPMLPTFIPRDLAEKILLIGKSINFIRQSCGDSDPLPKSQNALNSWSTVQDHLEEQMVALRQAIDTAYRVVSKKLLDVLFGKQKLLKHLNAARRYLLLGQGDFVRHLIDLLQGELAKPATSLMLHNLTATLDTAVRATNSQYDDPEVLQRLDAKLFQASPGDSGWDVFSLTYRVHGPISAVFKPEFLSMYLKVFNFLWRAKRMEHVLCNMWCTKMVFSRSLQDVPGVPHLLQQYHFLHSTMSHFVNQIQYYFMFEVLECSWSDLQNDMKKAVDLDQLIIAHKKFLHALVQQTFLGEESKSMLSQLRSILDLVIDFQKAQDTFYEAATDELGRRERDQSSAYEKTLAGKWGETNADTASSSARQTVFNTQLMPKMTAKVHEITKTFQDMVGRFLTMLTVHKDPNLRLLSFRIDFNEFYKSRVPEYQDACSPFRAKRKPRREKGPSGLSRPAFDGPALSAGN